MTLIRFIYNKWTTINPSGYPNENEHINVHFQSTIKIGVLHLLTFQTPIKQKIDLKIIIIIIFKDNGTKVKKHIT